MIASVLFKQTSSINFHHTINSDLETTLYKIGMAANTSTLCLRSTDEIWRRRGNPRVEEVRKVLRYVYADQISFAYRINLKTSCYGCTVDHPSQKQHSCLDDLDDDPILTAQLYSESENKINKQYLKLLFIETCTILWMNHMRVDFDSTLQEFLQCWVATDFQDLHKSLEVEEEIIKATVAAAMKLCSLEERLSKP